MFYGVITGDETLCFQEDPEKPKEHAAENTEITLVEKSTHV